MDIYQKIREFYKKDAKFSDILPLVIVEKYFRKEAFRGAKEALLCEEWEVISAIFRFMLDKHILSWEDVSDEDYMSCFPEFEKTINLTIFMYFVERFRTYASQQDLKTKKNFSQKNTKKEQVLKKTLANEDENKVAKATEDLFLDDFNPLMLKIAKYFQQEKFIADFNRALKLYTGLNDYNDENALTNKVHKGLIYSLWDYFLFNYHLTLNDETPLKYFLENQKKKLSNSERKFLKQLSSGYFSLLRIKYYDANSIWCEDLLLEKVFSLPLIRDNISENLNKLLCGHVNNDGVFFWEALPINKKLQKRIVEEIKTQYELFRKYTLTDASMIDFLKRHAAGVRHIVIAFSSFNRVKLLPIQNKNLPMLEKDFTISRFELEVEQLLINFSDYFHLGFYACTRMLKLYSDYYYMSSDKALQKRSPRAMAACIVLLFAKINALEIKEPRIVTQFFSTKLPLVQERMVEVENQLGCIPFDPRYLSEEGMVFSVYSM